MLLPTNEKSYDISCLISIIIAFIVSYILLHNPNKILVVELD